MRTGLVLQSRGLCRKPAWKKSNTERIDDDVLALLHLTSFTEGRGELALTRAWKGNDWAVLDRLHQKGLISDSKSEAKSVGLSKEGNAKAEALFRRLFCD